jgi:hypothetical protein
LHQISIFHYHLRPGGVTNVIELGAEALIRNLPNLKLLRLVCGSDENTDIINSRLNKIIKESGINKDPDFHFEIAIEPTISYSNPSGILKKNQIETLSNILEDKYGDSTWWIHNYQIGKNPLFTAAILHTAKVNPKRKMLLHIHDFPECARFDNLDKLFSAGISNPYPISENIVYSLINGRDLRLLGEAGVPEDRIFLLNNPVDEAAEKYTVKKDCMNPSFKDFYNYYAHTFPSVKPEGKTIFYPVRSIRRKNILEAGLVCAASDEPVNLVVGLPGTSAQEEAYSDICRRCFRDGLIPGVWSSGTAEASEVPSYRDMLKFSDMIISSSVQEGFGYLFINAVKLGTPLVARYLDILDGIRSVFPADSCFFYDRINIPMKETRLKELRTTYRKKLNCLNSYISHSAAKRIDAMIENAGSDGTIDFSYLPVEHQLPVLKKIKDSDNYRASIREHNSSLFSNFNRLLNKGHAEYHPAVEEFSLRSHAVTVEKIMNILTKKARPNWVEKINDSPKSIQQNLLDEFAKIDYMRLLYDYK